MSSIMASCSALEISLFSLVKTIEVRGIPTALYDSTTSRLAVALSWVIVLSVSPQCFCTQKVSWLAILKCVEGKLDFPLLLNIPHYEYTSGLVSTLNTAITD